MERGRAGRDELSAQFWYHSVGDDKNGKILREPEQRTSSCGFVLSLKKPIQPNPALPPKMFFWRLLTGGHGAVCARAAEMLKSCSNPAQILKSCSAERDRNAAAPSEWSQKKAELFGSILHQQNCNDLLCLRGGWKSEHESCKSTDPGGDLWCLCTGLGKCFHHFSLH